MTVRPSCRSRALLVESVSDEQNLGAHEVVRESAFEMYLTAFTTPCSFESCFPNAAARSRMPGSAFTVARAAAKREAVKVR
jgi:hypothetical protein